MQRRVFMALAGACVLALPSRAEAQTSGQARRIGVLMNGIAANTAAQSYVAEFVQALGNLGWTDGQNLRIDYRWNAGEPALARSYAA